MPLMMHYPYYDNGGTHWGLLIVMIVAVLAFFAILAWEVVHIVRLEGPYAAEGSRPASNASSEPLRFLDEHLARGEMDVDEYTRRRDILRGNGPAAGSQ